MNLPPLEILAYVAAAIGGILTCISFFMKTIIPLRVVSAAANLAFVVYALVMHSWAVLGLNAALFPLNCWRTLAMMKLTRRVRAASATGDPSGVWLRPYMRTKKFKQGDILFRKGDPAAEVYYLVDGGIDFPEIGVVLPPGRIFGEIAFFTHERKRTQTARCTVDSTVMTIDESTLKELYYQNPEFGFHLVSLVARRLAGNVDQLEAKLAALPYGVEPHPIEHVGH
ncbi:MAG: cyclic nucleotide-binding domain-containing protein [Burkholderiales bacterium]